MKIHFTKSFKKAYLSRIQTSENLIRIFDEVYDLFFENPSDPVLKDHQLSGRLQRYRAFSVTGEIRVMYHIHNNTAYFMDIGTHNQVYR